MKNIIKITIAITLVFTLCFATVEMHSKRVFADDGNNNPPISELSDESQLDINDQVLEKALAKAAHVDEGCTITYGDMKKVTYFGVPEGVKNYSALQYLTSLRLLDICCNDANYKDIFRYAPIGMTQLSFNNANKIDASLITKYTSLKLISFGNTDIQNAKMLSNLKDVDYFYASNNNFETISFLLNLNKLNELYVVNCNIKDKKTEKSTINALKNKNIKVYYISYKNQLPIKISYSNPKNNLKISSIPKTITITFSDKFNIGVPRTIHDNNIVIDGKCLELKLTDNKGKTYKIRSSFNNVDGNKLIVKINEKLNKNRTYKLVIPSKWIYDNNCKKIINQKDIVYSFSIK